MLYELLYSSSAIEEFNGEDIKLLLEQCYTNNKKYGITGCMIYKKREFIQVIEGEKEYVLDLFRNIKKDKRHTKIKVIWKGETTERSFNDWQMGFYNLNVENKEQIEGFADILKEKISKNLRTNHESTASRLFEVISSYLRARE